MTSRWWAALLVVSACVDHDDGLTVRVDQTHRGSGEAAPRAFVTDRGYAVTLTRMYLVVRTVQLVPCDGVAASSRSRRWRDLLVLERTAFAHSTGVPDYLGVASVDDLMLADGTSAAIGVMQMRDVDHCAVNVTLGPASTAALHLPGDISMLGRSLHLQGTYLAPGGSEARPLLIEVDDALPQLVPIARLSLTADHPNASVTIVHSDYQHWLDGLDLDTVDAASAGAAVIRRAVAGLRVEVGSEIAPP